MTNSIDHEPLEYSAAEAGSLESFFLFSKPRSHFCSCHLPYWTLCIDLSISSLSQPAM